MLKCLDPSRVQEAACAAGWLSHSHALLLISGGIYLP